MYNYGASDNMREKRGFRHGMRYSKIYRVWAGIISRTNYKGDTNYHRYGGRGIKVCDRWRKFESFFRDMGETYKEGLQIERVDNNGNYEPKNCCWVTRSQQLCNKRNNHFVEWEGKRQTLKQWGDELGFKPDTLRFRLGEYGWSIGKAFTTPVLRRV